MAVDLSSIAKVKNKYSQTKNSSLTNAKNFGVTVNKTTNEGVALLTSEDIDVNNAITTYFDDVIDNLNSSLNVTKLLDSSSLKEMTTIDGFGRALTSTTTYNSIERAIGATSLAGASDILKNAFVSDVNGAFKSATNGWFGDLVTQDGEITFNGIKNFRDEAGTHLIDLVAGVAPGLSNLVDRYVNNSILSALLKRAIDYGVNDFLVPLMDGFIFPEDAQTAAVNAIEDAIEKADIYCIDSILGALNDDRKLLLQASYPYSVVKILKGFYLRYTDTETMYGEIREKLLRCLTVLGGEKWYANTSFMGDEVYDLSLCVMSDDCLTILKYGLEDDSKLIPLILCRNKFTEGNSIDKFKRHFPETPILE